MYDPQRLQPGDVILVSGSGAIDVLAAIIRFATVSPYHHAALVGDGCLIEASFTVQRTPLDAYAETGEAFSVRASERRRLLAVAAATARLGTPYGIRELLADGARYFLHLPLIYPWNARRQTCSGLIAYAYRDAGIPLTFEPCPSPASLSYSPLLQGARPWMKAPGAR